MLDNYIIQYILISLILIVLAIAIAKTKKKDFKIDANKLVECLGGKDNIVDYEFAKSRFIVTLKDVTLAKKEEIQKLGARGIVEIDNQLKIIIGDNADQIRKCIKDLK